MIDRLVELQLERNNVYFICGNHDFALACFLGLYPDASQDLSWTCADYESWADELLWGSDEYRSKHPNLNYTHADTMHLQGLRWAAEALGKTDSVFSSLSTFASYNVAFGDREGFLREMSQSHQDFIRDLPFIFEKSYPFGGVLAVHAGLRSVSHSSLQAARDRRVDCVFVPVLQNRKSVVSAPDDVDPNTIVISGHHKTIINEKNRIVLDDPDMLSAIVLPERRFIRCDGDDVTLPV